MRSGTRRHGFGGRGRAARCAGSRRLPGGATMASRGGSCGLVLFDDPWLVRVDDRGGARGEGVEVGLRGSPRRELFVIAEAEDFGDEVVLVREEREELRRRQLGAVAAMREIDTDGVGERG